MIVIFILKVLFQALFCPFTSMIRKENDDNIFLT